MLYMPGLEEDERQHARLCQAYQKGIPCVHGTVTGGKIVEKTSTYSIVQWKPALSSKKRKIEEMNTTSRNKTIPSQWPLLVQMIANDLGMDESTALWHLSKQTVFLYLGIDASNRQKSNNSNNNNRTRILGVATAQSLSQAYRMSSLHNRSIAPSKAMLGIGVLWTHLAARHRGIATTLVTAARQYTIFSVTVPKALLAFSTPTQAGYDFAVTYLYGTGGNDQVNGTTRTRGPLVYEM